MKRDSLLVQTLLVAVCLALVCCSRTAGPPKIRIAVGTGTGASTVVYLAKSLGFFEQEGLDVEVEELSGAAKTMEALAGGSVEVGLSTYEQTVQLCATGREVKNFFLISTSLTLVLAGAPGAPAIKQIEDLKGGTVGVTSIGSATQNWVNMILIKHGMKPSDVTPVSIGGGATAVAAVENRKVDAALLTSPAFETLRDRRPDIPVLLDLRTADGTKNVFGTPQIPVVGAVATSRWLAENPATAKRIARGLAKAARWMHDRPAAEIATKLPPSLQSPGSDAAVRSLELLRPSFSLDGRMIPGGPEVIRDYLKLVVDPALSVDLAKTYTDEFLEAKP